MAAARKALPGVPDLKILEVAEVLSQAQVTEVPGHTQEPPTPAKPVFLETQLPLPLLKVLKQARSIQEPFYASILTVPLGWNVAQISTYLKKLKSLGLVRHASKDVHGTHQWEAVR